MVPGDWLSVLFFFILVAPGLLFDLLSDRRRAGATESTFREASRIVLASFIFSGIAIGILAAVRAIKPQWFLDPDILFREGSSYLAQEYQLTLPIFAAEAALALFIAWLTHVYFAHKQGATIRPVSAWTQVFKRDCPTGHDVYIRVRLTEGITYIGLLANFTADLAIDGREVVLAQPLYSASGSNPLTQVPSDYQRVIISMNAIQTISVAYYIRRNKTEPTDTSTESS